MFDFELVTIDRRRKASLTSQVYEEIRAAIMSNRLAEGTRIPSSRALSEQNGVSRTTILSVLDQLIAEGFLRTRKGSGTFVCADIPGDEAEFVWPTQQTGLGDRDGISSSDFCNWSKMAENIESCSFPYSGEISPFRPGVPALDTFPFDRWSQVWKQSWQATQLDDLWYRTPTGCSDLRTQIASYLSAHRGVICTADQVVLIGGTVQFLDLISRLMIDKGDSVYVENPGFTSARQIFSVNGARLKPLAVDQHGAVIPVKSAVSRKDKLVTLTPSHQFPLGITMSIDRRLEWLEWARKNNCIIIEDDYDSEFRYSQKPVPAMQGLDRSENTIYVGSFSKVVFPSLSLAYAVIPPRLCEKVAGAYSVLCRPPSAPDQAALERFIKQGHFLRHVRRLRRTHRQRRDVFVECVEKLLAGKIQLSGTNAGLHCIGQILNSGKQSDLHFCELLAEKNIFCKSLSQYFLADTPESQVKHGLVMGFAGSNPDRIRQSVRRMASIL